MSLTARHALTCPHCGKVNDMHECITTPAAQPEDGDALLCIDCGHWAIFEDGRSRAPTDEEKFYLGTNAECIRYALAWHAMMLERKKRQEFN